MNHLHHAALLALILGAAAPTLLVLEDWRRQLAHKRRRRAVHGRAFARTRGAR